MNKEQSETICITGMGVVSAIGTSVPEFWTALLNGESGAREWEDLKEQNFRHISACRIPSIKAPLHRRGRVMAVKAAGEAIKDADLKIKSRVGIYAGTTMGESAAFEQAAEGHELLLEQATGISFAKAIQDQFQFRGPTVALGTACAAGNYAISSGMNALRRGIVDAAIVGGADPFSRIAMTGFSRSRAMSPDYARPFDKNRKGMLLGEGAAFLVLEKQTRANARGANCWAKVSASGFSCDAYHLTAPRPDGSGGIQAMRAALKQGNVTPEQVGWICAHGSGTRASDAMEALAISEVFSGHEVKVSGIKGATGHPLGAATAIEAVVTALSLYHQILPPTVHCTEVDTNFDLAIVKEKMAAPYLEWALNCGYAFGGLNSVLLMGKI